MPNPMATAAMAPPAVAPTSTAHNAALADETATPMATMNGLGDGVDGARRNTNVAPIRATNAAQT